MTEPATHVLESSADTAIPPRAIHAMIPKDVLGEELGERIESSMRPAR